MARGNEIVVSSEPRGLFTEGVIGAALTPKPGTIMQIQAATALQGGRHTFEIYAPGADGDIPKGPYFVLLEDNFQGKTATDAYAAGDRCRLYVPVPGDELNLLIKNLSGTGDTHTKGEILLVDHGTGLLIADTGTPMTKVAILLETLAALTADTLAWCQWTGY